MASGRRATLGVELVSGGAEHQRLRFVPGLEGKMAQVLQSALKDLLLDRRHPASGASPSMFSSVHPQTENCRYLMQLSANDWWRCNSAWAKVRTSGACSKHPRNATRKIRLFVFKTWRTVGCCRRIRRQRLPAFLARFFAVSGAAAVGAKPSSDEARTADRKWVSGESLATRAEEDRAAAQKNSVLPGWTTS